VAKLYPSMLTLTRTDPGATWSSGDGSGRPGASTVARMVSSTGGSTLNHRRARTSSNPATTMPGTRSTAARPITSSSMVMGTTGNRSSATGQPSGWR
jgi:hypothetical protein